MLSLTTCRKRSVNTEHVHREQEEETHHPCAISVKLFKLLGEGRRSASILKISSEDTHASSLVQSTSGGSFLRLLV